MSSTRDITPLSMNSTDRELLAAANRGEERAWRLLVDRYQRLVYSIPRRYGLDNASCDDVFQGVFTAAFKHLHTIRDGQSLAKWLMTLASRQAWAAVQSRKRAGTPGTTMETSIEESAVPAADTMERWETQHKVNQGLAELGGKCEQLLRALFMGPGPVGYTTVAEQLGIPVGSIGPTRERCMKRLAEILKEFR